MPSRLVNAPLYFQRLIPIAGVAWNRARFRGLRTGLRVEISGTGTLIYGQEVRIGEGTRIDLAEGSRLVFGNGVMIGRGAYFSLGAGQRQTIGDRTGIQDGCRFYGSVKIGRGCVFAPNVFASAGAHTFAIHPHLSILEQERLAPATERAIQMLDDCWIGINVALMPGVSVARGCVVGANAVVTKDLEPYSVAVGAPARTIRKRFDFSPPARVEAARELDLPYFYDGFELAPGRRDEHVCEGNFTLALSRPAARIVRLCLSGDGTEISHGALRQPMPRTPGVIEFALDANASSSPFLTFHADGRTRIRWAELV
jgi:acetyltransferase-like isoleucine patch superfamily enzyme